MESHALSRKMAYNYLQLLGKVWLSEFLWQFAGSGSQMKSIVDTVDTTISAVRTMRKLSTGEALKLGNWTAVGCGHPSILFFNKSAYEWPF